MLRNLTICGLLLALAGCSLNANRMNEPDSARQIDASPHEEKLGFDQPIAAAWHRYQQRLSADGTIPENAMLNAKEQRDEMVAGGSVAGIGDEFARWTWLGPGNIGGRIRAILIHPTQTQIRWIGSATGGIWKTDDTGQSWRPLNDFMASLSIGSMALHPVDPDILYAGTGEGFFDTPDGSSNTAAVRGAGIFVSTDAGETWQHMPSTAGPDWYFVNRIAINPDDPNLMLAATTAGIFRTVNAGDTWTMVDDVRTLDLKLDPSNPSNAVAGRNTGVALYSTDAGLTWQQATGIGKGARVELRYAPNDTSIVYAALSRNNAITIYRSTDGGQTYALRTLGSSVQTWSSYNSVIWVDPTNSNTLVIGGVRLFRSLDGGATIAPAFGGAHADHHVIVEHPEFDGNANRRVFFGTDGGIFRTQDVLGDTVVEQNNNLGITQFYGAAINPDTGVAVGGTQDNGSLQFTGNTEGWNRYFGGDGGFAAADPTDPNYFYGEVQRARIHRSTNGGASAGYIYQGPNPIADAGTQSINFIPFFMLDPNDPNTMLVAARRLWRSTNVKAAQPDWSAVKPTIEEPGPTPPPGPRNSHFAPNSPWNMSTIAVAQGNSDIIWVGYNNGHVWKTANGTAAEPDWTPVDEDGGALPDRWVSRIVIDRNDHSRVYVSVMGWAPDSIWLTTDDGGSWQAVTGSGPGALPTVPVSALAAHRTQPGWLYAGTDLGIFASRDDGQTWTTSTVGPGTVAVDELVWKDDRTLLAATHGRGLYLGEVGPFAGDLNCDGSIDAFDIEPFILALFEPANYEILFPDCDITLGDLNGDGEVNAFDIEPFLDVLFGG